MRILVTGAGGGIGREVVKTLVADGHHVVGLDIQQRPAELDVAWVQTDLASAASDGRLFEGLDAVIHLAGIPGPGVVPDQELFLNNVGATYSVIEAACVNQVPRVVIASSISIYGMVWADKVIQPAEIPLTEESEVRPADAYALAKETDEAIARMMCRRHDVSIAPLRLPRVSTIDDIQERSVRVEIDRSEGSRELWAYLTLDDAARAFSLAASAVFTGFLIAHVVSPQSLATLDALLP